MQGVEAKAAKPAVKPGPVGFQQDPPFNPAVDNKAPSPCNISWSSWKISSSPISLPSVRSFSAHASANRLLSSRGLRLRLERTLGASGPGRSCAATPGISSGAGGMLEQDVRGGK